MAFLVKHFQVSTLILALILPLTVVAAVKDQSRFYGSMGIGLLNFDFKEFDQQGEQLVHESGWLRGLSASLTGRKKRFTANLQASLFQGEIDYDGQTQLGASIESKTDERVWEVSTILGYQLPASNAIQPGLYIGAEYRHWNRNIQSVGSVLGLNETRTWWNMLAGLKMEWQKNQNIWSMDGRLMRTVNPEVNIDFLNAWDSARLDMEERWGWKTTFGWEHMLTPSVSASASAFYESWEFGRSGTEALTQNGLPIGTVSQPRSESNNFGVVLSIQRHW